MTAIYRKQIPALREDAGDGVSQVADSHPIVRTDGHVYKPGLDRIRENVISSHFMHGLCADARLELYDEEQYSAKCVKIDDAVVDDILIPCLLRACGAFASERAAAAKQRASENYRQYGLDDPSHIGPSHFITEVMFDRQFRRGPQQTCARHLLCEKVKERMAAGAPIVMVIPALPFKISSPLKTRGPRPDLADVNFILGLYEIAATIELLYREALPELRGRLAGFTIVSDGSRFERLVGEPRGRVDVYRTELTRWIERLGLEEYVELLDYERLLRERLPAHVQTAKRAIRSEAACDYERTMWAIFDPCDMAATLKTAALIDPDPEMLSAEGRFVALLKSLVFTINYTALDRFTALPARQYRALYRELTGHIFEPYAILSPAELAQAAEKAGSRDEALETTQAKESLRRAMLSEAWSAAIAYIAEIKSDRELEEDPILTSLPHHFRWTIHAKPGQLALRVPTALGKCVQAWAGAAVFKRAKKNGIKLCTLPILALEGAGAIPVGIVNDENFRQPLFYIYPDVSVADFAEFLTRVERQLVRKRAS